MTVILPEIWKKMLPLHSTFTRPLLVPNIGAVIVAVPSLGVLAVSTVLKPLSSSYKKRMFTLAQLTGAVVVLATFQLTVCRVADGQVVPVKGAVTLNGPEVLVTVAFMAALLTPPLLSRTVRRKVMVRLIVGRDSPGLDSEPSKILASAGKIRAGLDTGL